MLIAVRIFRVMVRGRAALPRRAVVMVSIFGLLRRTDARSYGAGKGAQRSVRDGNCKNHCKQRPACRPHQHPLLPCPELDYPNLRANEAAVNFRLASAKSTGPLKADARRLSIRLASHLTNDCQNIVMWVFLLSHINASEDFSRSCVTGEFRI